MCVFLCSLVFISYLVIMPFMSYVTLCITLLLEGAIQMNLPCLYLLNWGVKVSHVLTDNTDTYCNFTL